MKINVFLDVGIGSLLVRKQDIQTIAGSARFKSSPVGRFHNSRTAAGQGREASPRQFCADRPRKFVVPIIFLETCGTEDRNSGPEMIKTFEAADELILNSLKAGRFLIWRTHMSKKRSFLSGG